MAAFVIVGAKELGEGRDAFGFTEVGTGVGPFLLEGPVESFDLTVCLRPVRSGPFVLDLVVGYKSRNMRDR